jgi:hypothetical protein
MLDIDSQAGASERGRDRGLSIGVAPLRHLISDRFAIRGAITAIRDAFSQLDERPRRAPAPADRRKHGRHEFEVAVRITGAVVEDGAVRVLHGARNSISARTRDISLAGIGLAHASPLPGRCAVAVFTPRAGNPICLVVEAAWSQPLAADSWLSGVSILGLIDSAEPPEFAVPL